MLLGTGKNALVNGELNGLSSGSGAQVIHAGLQALLPSVEMHAGQLTHGRSLQVHVKRLALANESTTVGSKIEDLLLTDLPNCLVNSLDVVGDGRDVLNRAVVCNDHVLHVIVP